MNHLAQTPKTGEILIYRDRQRGLTVPVKVLEVWASVCKVEVLQGGLNNSMKGRVIRAHVATLSKS